MMMGRFGLTMNIVSLFLLFLSVINAQIALPTFQGVHKPHSSCASTSTIEVRVASDNDDAEEAESGSMYRNSSDLELVYDTYQNQGSQQVGMRFLNITIPQGTVITNAYLQFTVDETSSSSCSLTIYGEDTDDATQFSSSSNNISGRTKTSASVDWTPDSWTSVGANHNSPDLQSIAQEIVNRSGWNSGNDMVLIVTGTGTGKRTAESYRGSSSKAPLIHIEYCTP